MELTPRKLEILRRVVEEYVATGQPVGSKALVERSRLDVSSSTVRSELFELEAIGLLTHPHTSAGRIPTQNGYRVYTEELVVAVEGRPAPFPLDLTAMRNELEEAMRRTTETLSPRCETEAEDERGRCHDPRRVRIAHRKLEAPVRRPGTERVREQPCDRGGPRADEDGEDEIARATRGHDEKREQHRRRIDERALGFEQRRVRRDRPGGRHDLPRGEGEEPACEGSRTAPDLDLLGDDPDGGEPDRPHQQKRAPAPGEVPAAPPGHHGERGGRHDDGEEALHHPPTR